MKMSFHLYNIETCEIYISMTCDRIIIHDNTAFFYDGMHKFGECYLDFSKYGYAIDIVKEG